MTRYYPYCALFVVFPFLCPGAPSADEGEVSPISRIEWMENILVLHAPKVPSKKIEIWYLEAFCRTGSTDRVWNETVIPHETRLVEQGSDGQSISLESRVEPGVVVTHKLRVVKDGVTFDLRIENPTEERVDMDWAQPCMRVGGFSGLDQEHYHQRCFIFTGDGQAMLDQLPRNSEARYIGGQVYVPEGIDLADVNPRPISTIKPAKNLIGCVSADEKWLTAMAWDQTQELFQGVIKCIHSDFRIGGLDPGEVKILKGKVYLMSNDVSALLKAYDADFGGGTR